MEEFGLKLAKGWSYAKKQCCKTIFIIFSVNRRVPYVQQQTVKLFLQENEFDF
jgi:hypothetical protein